MVLLASSFDQSKYLKAADFERERKFRIKTTTVETVGTGADQQRKLCVWFHNDEHGLVLNRINNRTIRGAFGDAVDGWVGKIIVVFPTQAEFRGHMVPSLRVRIPPPKQAAGNGHAAAPAPEPVKPPVVPPAAAAAVDEDLNDDIDF
jgi:hypothetical protein